MAIRVQNGGNINFGVLLAETIITHARVGFGSNDLTVRSLLTTRTIAIGGQAQFDIGEIDLVFRAGDMLDPGLSDLLNLYFSQAVYIDAMTSLTDVVATSGYSQQTSNNWSRTQESD